MTKHPKLRLGTRASPMAIAVAEHAKKVIIEKFPDIDVSIHTYVSEGDTIKGSLAESGGKGLFTKNLESLLLAGEIDCAIHAVKDIPADVPMHDDLEIIAFLPREDPRDVLVLRDKTWLEPHANIRIGTSAPRRKSSLMKLYPNVDVLMCRGNVNTRLHELGKGTYDALVLAASGLHRLGFENRISHTYGIDEMIPAVGQGVLCLQVKKDSIKKCSYLSSINDDSTKFLVGLERDFLQEIKGNCHSSVAAHAFRGEDGGIRFMSAIYDPRGDGQLVHQASYNMHDKKTSRAGIEAAEILLSSGGDKWV